MKKRLSIFMLFLLMTVCLNPGITAGQSDAPTAGTLHNPLNAYAGSDPWLVYYEGNYYLAATTWTSELTMRSSPTLAGLKTAAPVQIYYETDPSRCCNMWAPEFYLLDGPDGPRWYFYYSAGTSGTLDNQHTHVLESAGTDPLGPYTYKGRVFDPYNDTWAIDGSVLQLDGSLYFLFSAWLGPQSLFIAPMSNPWTISGPRTRISQPNYSWEANVNEGPVALYHDDDIFVVYSASPCSGPDYKLGMLTYTGGDPLSAESWVKYPDPVFQRSDENNVFGPGHNGFFTSPDGTENWIVYHANDQVTDGCDNGRTTRVQQFTWKEDGTPDFGVPVAITEEITAPAGDMGVDPFAAFDELVGSRFRSYDDAGEFYLRNVDTIARLTPVIGTPSDSQFYVVPGLADPEAVSVMSVYGAFLRHEGNVMYFHTNDGSETFAADATWWIRPGLADSAWISFEAYNQPGYYLGQQFGVMALVQAGDRMADIMREGATFLEVR